MTGGGDVSAALIGAVAALEDAAAAKMGGSVASPDKTADLAGTLPSSAAALSAQADAGLDAPPKDAAFGVAGEIPGVSVSMPEADMKVSAGVDLPGPLPTAGDGVGASGAGEMLCFARSKFLVLCAVDDALCRECVDSCAVNVYVLFDAY